MKCYFAEGPEKISVGGTCRLLAPRKNRAYFPSMRVWIAIVAAIAIAFALPSACVHAGEGALPPAMAESAGPGKGSSMPCHESGAQTSPHKKMASHHMKMAGDPADGHHDDMPGEGAGCADGCTGGPGCSSCFVLTGVVAAPGGLPSGPQPQSLPLPALRSLTGQASAFDPPPPRV